jgi:hypothetical protein
VELEATESASSRLIRSRYAAVLGVGLPLRRLGIDETLPIAGLRQVWGRPIQEKRMRWLAQRISPPRDFPVFKEVEQPLDGEGIRISFPSPTLHGARRWPIAFSIYTPGFTSEEIWFIH